MPDASIEASGAALHVMPPAALAERRRPAAWMLTACFSATLFTSAALLFTVEPMFAKMVLPRLGGSPAVWNTCVVFFQAAMLAGYAYAHVSSRRLTLGQQAAVHVLLIVLAAFVLPVAIPADWVPPVDGSPIPGLLALLFVTIGAPFFIVSATAPLLQKWFSETDHPSARDPYFLYAASNLGSIAALLAYPFLVEPLWPLSLQSEGWTISYVLFGALTVICVLAVPSRTRASQQVLTDAPSEPISWARRGRWLALAFVPSSLMLGVTTFLSTDVAAMPLLWTIPLALYLLTFVIAFASRPIVPARATSRAALVLVLSMMALTLVGIVQPAWVIMPIHLAGFFTAALMLHGELSRDRPSTHHLTEFYLWISIGGLLGGAFNTLLAPILFSSVLEYPLVLALALGFRPPPARSTGRTVTLQDLGLASALAITITIALVALRTGAIGSIGLSAAAGVGGILFAASAKRPIRLGLALMLVVLGMARLTPPGGDVLHAERTFYGVHRVTSDRASGRQRLFHGSTLHGEQSLDPRVRQEPLTYYHRTGPVGQMLGQLSEQLEHVGVIGLGAGSLAAYALPGQQWTFFEIDPAVARIAANPEWFTYLSGCGSACTVVLGDARLSLASRDDTYDLIVLDAFSSDAIPAHLLTREALALYLGRLSNRGVIAFHISNRHLDLRPAVASLTAERGLATRVQLHRPSNESEAKTSLWIVAARNADALGPLAGDPRWQELTTRSPRVWSDDYSDILSVMRQPH